MPLISKKKPVYRVCDALRDYLVQYSRELALPIQYSDLLRYDNSISLYDRSGHDTLWETVFYPASDVDEILLALKTIYAELKADGDMSVTGHLTIDRVDLCTYGNTKPFRIRVRNQVNDNFDYFYIKRADASRVYGLELEHILSPNRISYLTSSQTLIEEHIAGIPGDGFFNRDLYDPATNPIRLCKEFVKFNERCFVRLLGDMHSSNFVVDVTPDFDEVYYRIRAIDFDQQSYEGRKSVYLPQYYIQNRPIIELGMKYMTPESVRQYQIEERALIAGRLRVEKTRFNDLMTAMRPDMISTPENVSQLRESLARHHRSREFLRAQTMGDLVWTSLEVGGLH
ncbi:hypothetical protein F5984_22695 [Rudanella paleaurantiibacter]|uniref:Uncharacterized protein n=1 Tax=Rudanella paleaurantiibacter TaxID=2614655 RepID=A0A7J5TTG5_9BACT|nr:hypothetical protein [Rudanella paleaurantiibacter]KAB7727048.1 hypothetical protein F5984_22695 [Rudanella paleaurantiibacter]